MPWEGLTKSSSKALSICTTALVKTPVAFTTTFVFSVYFFSLSTSKHSTAVILSLVFVKPVALQ